MTTNGFTHHFHVTIQAKVVYLEDSVSFVLPLPYHGWEAFGNLARPLAFMPNMCSETHP